MRSHRILALSIALAAVINPIALAETVVSPCALPSPLTGHRLVKDYDDLVAVQKRLDPRIQWFNKWCTQKMEVGSQLDQDCGAEKSRSMPEWAKYEPKRKQYERDRAEAIRAAQAVVEQRLKITKASLQRNAARGGQLDQDIEEWMALEGEARHQADEAILEMGKAFLLEHLKESVNAGLKLAIREDRRTSWIWPSFTGKPLQQLKAEAMGRLMAAKDAKELTTALEWVDKTAGVTLGSADLAADRHDREKLFQFLIEVGKVGLNDPHAIMIVQDARIGTAALYGWAVAKYARDSYREIAAVGEAQYEDAKRLAAIYAKDLKTKNDLARKPTGRSCS
jgi:hypothetical protein